MWEGSANTLGSLGPHLPVIEVAVRDLAQVWYRSDPSGQAEIMACGVNADGLHFFWGILAWKIYGKIGIDHGKSGFLPYFGSEEKQALGQKMTGKAPQIPWSNRLAPQFLNNI